MRNIFWPIGTNNVAKRIYPLVCYVLSTQKVRIEVEERLKLLTGPFGLAIISAVAFKLHKRLPILAAENARERTPRSDENFALLNSQLSMTNLSCCFSIISNASRQRTAFVSTYYTPLNDVGDGFRRWDLKVFRKRVSNKFITKPCIIQFLLTCIFSHFMP